MQDEVPLKKRRLHKSEKETVNPNSDSSDSEDENEEAEDEVEDSDDEFINKRRYVALYECMNRYFSEGSLLINVKHFEGKPHILATIKKDDLIFNVIFLSFLFQTDIYTDFMESMNYCKRIYRNSEIKVQGVYVLVDPEIEEIDIDKVKILSEYFCIKDIEII